MSSDRPMSSTASAACRPTCSPRSTRRRRKARGGRRGHHRPRHGQSGQPDAAAHRRQAGRGGAGPAHPPLLGAQGIPGLRQALAALLSSAASASSSTRRPRWSRRWAPRKGWPIWPRRSPARATRSWCPTRPIRSTRSASSSPVPRSAVCPATPDDDMLRALDRAVRHSVPKPTALIVNFPSNPTALAGRPRLLPRDRRVRSPARDLDPVRPRLCRDLFRRQAAALDPAGARREGHRGRVHLAVQDLLDAGLAHGLRRRQPAADQRADPDEVVSRLRRLHADPGRRGRRAERAAGLRGPRCARCTASAATC